MNQNHLIVIFCSLVFLCQAGSSQETVPPPASIERLLHPEVTQLLKLTDQQKTDLQTIIEKKRAAAESGEPENSVAEFSQQALGLLTPEQLVAFKTIPRGRISFSFHEAKWSEVLKWFAEQAGRSLVVNDPPPGTFTYNDSKSYSPIEALDLLNGVLITRGYTLIQKERLLICVNISQNIPDGLVPETTLEQLDQYGTFELIKITFPLGAKPVATVNTEIQPLLGVHGSSVALQATNKLIVTTNAGRMRIIAATIASIPEPVIPPKPTPGPKPELVSYPSEQIDTAAAIELITKITGNISIGADLKAKKINVFATPEQHAVIAKVIEQIKTDAAAESKPILKSYQLTTPLTKSLLEQLQQTFPGSSLSMDDVHNRLLVFAQPEMQETISKNLEAMQGVMLTSGDDAVKVLALNNTTAEAVVAALSPIFQQAKLSAGGAADKVIVHASPSDLELISELVQSLDQRAQTKQSVYLKNLDEPLSTEEISALSSIAPNATITTQQNGKRLMIVASLADFAPIENLINQIQSVKEPVTNRSLQFYELSQTQRQRFLQLFQKIDPSLNEVEIVPQADENKLAILATPTQHDAIAAIVSNLNEQFAATIRDLKIYPVTGDQGKRFQELYQKLNPGLKTIEIIQQADDQKLTILASQQEHEAIRQLLETLDGQFAIPTRQLKTYNVQPGLKQQFTTHRNSVSDALTKITILDSGDQEQLAVLATDAEHLEIASVLRQLTDIIPKPQEQELKLYPITPDLRSRILPIISAAGETYKNVKIIEGTQENELVIWASAQDQVKIAALLTKLRREIPIYDNHLHAYSITHSEPSSLQTILAEFFPDTKIVVDDKTGQIMVWGDDERQNVIKTAIEQMDVPKSSRSEQRMSMYRMGEVDARDVVSFLVDLFTEMTIVSERDTNSIIAWGSAKDHERLKQTIQQFKDQESKRSVSVYPTGQRASSEIRSILSDIVPNANLVSDDASQSVVAWATADEHIAIAAALEKIVSLKTPAGKLVVYDTPTTDADYVINMLQKVAPHAEYADAAGDTKVMAWATEDDHAKINSIIEATNAGDPTVKDRIAKSYQVDPRSADQILDFISTAAPNAKPIQSPDAKSVMVWALEADHAIIEKLVQSIQENSPGANKLVGYSVKPQTVNDLQSYLSTRFTTISIYHAANVNQLFIWASEQDHQQIGPAIATWQKTVDAEPLQEIRVYATGDFDPDQLSSALPASLVEGVSISTVSDRNALLIKATKEQHVELKTTIDDIVSKLPNRKQNTIVYRFQNASPSSILTPVSQLIPGATLVVDESTQSLVVTAYTEDHEQIAAAIRQLDIPTTNESPTKVYSFKHADPNTAITTLRQLLPNATLAVDESTRNLIATANMNDHARIQTLVATLDTAGDALTSTVYALQHADPSSTLPTLRQLLPNATLAVDASTKSLIAIAKEQDHLKIKTFVEKLDVPAESTTSIVYSFAKADPNAVMTSLTRLLPNATLAVDKATGSLIATANFEDHERIRAVVRQLDQSVGRELVAKVYAFTTANPEVASATLVRLLPNVTVAVDASTKSLVATATPSEHKQIQSIIEQLDRSSTNQVTSVVYRLKIGDPAALQQSLRALIPNATTSVDLKTGSLIATATESEHKIISSTVTQFDQQSDRTQVIQAYGITRADVNSVFETLRQTFTGSQQVVISLDQVNRTIIARAPPLDQQTIASLVARMETSVLMSPGRQLQIYSLGDVNGDRIISSLEVLLAEIGPKPELNVAEFTNELYAVATVEQHAKITSSLSQLAGEKTQVDVFQLRAIDPFTVEQAIDRVFENSFDAPVVSSDIDTQQLIVRGTKSQIETIKELLVKLGETSIQQDANSTSRTISFRGGDMESALRQLQEVWPKLRKNRIQILRPTQIRQVEVEGNEKKDDVSDNDPSTESSETSCGDEVADPNIDDSQANTNSNTTDVTASQSSHQDQPAPLLIVPGNNSVTISSEDPEALQQAYALLDTLAQRASSGAAGNFAVYPLKNAGARQTAKTLQDLFKQMPETLQTNVLGRVSLVADNRMNAIIIHGRPTDRRVVIELLNVLDSDYVDDSLAATKAEIIPVVHTSAKRIHTILQSVYKTQMTTGGDRPEIEIPEGVAPDVASVLQQINAATAGPVLTLEVDEITNSLVMLAPLQLGEKIRELVKKLDQSAKDEDARSIRVISLKDTNVREIQDAIDQLLDK